MYRLEDLHAYSAEHLCPQRETALAALGV